MVVNQKSIVSSLEILKRKLGGELLAPITITEFSNGVCKGGSPIGADGKIANSASAIGILLNDVYEENPNGSLVKAFATINLANAEKNSGLTIDPAVKTALANIKFE